jgi:hypothetical protein
MDYVYWQAVSVNIEASGKVYEKTPTWATTRAVFCRLIQKRRTQGRALCDLITRSTNVFESEGMWCNVRLAKHPDFHDGLNPRVVGCTLFPRDTENP